MPRGQQGKARRRQQRKQQRAAEKRRQNQAPPNSKEMEASGGWLSMIWGSGEADKETGIGMEGDEDLHEDTTLATFGEQESDKDEGADEGGGSWWDYVPKWSWGATEEREGYADRRGDDDNHIDMLSDKASRKLGLEVGADGVEAEAELERTRKLVDIAGKGEGELGPLKGELETDVALGHATANAKAKGSIGSDGVKGEGEIGGGLYAASAEAQGSLGLKVPFVNARLMGEASLGGNVGVGGKAEGQFQADSSGFKAGGKLGATVGVGGQVGWGLGVKKDDPKKGWFE